MPIPDFQSLMRPLLVAMADGREHTAADVRQAVAKQFNLTEAELSEMLPSGHQPVLNNRVGWSKTDLEKAGAIQTVRRGVYMITERGKKLLAENPVRIDVHLLQQFPEYREYRPGGSGNGGASTAGAPEQEVADGAGTPQERLEAAHREMRRTLEAELLGQLTKASPGFFERTVVELLVRMGYGGSLQDAGQAIGRSGDGGVDGIIKEDRLGLDVIYVQAKRWAASVGRPDVQAFAGSLEGHRARKGVFITTSRFTTEAKDYVGRIEKKIILIDGEQLASLMAEVGVGVTTVQALEVKRLDLDYFAEE